ncbi:hypothetical protein Tcan_11027 [Toxocara canis]|uniref:Uncharacterized protein n=1 Tax=Toxocara canis TaxID=6265 RepID=A0A0B2W4X7_TOXCA|nr:hypothetical protein Tcan_11027 [Toxocara canis]
MLAMLARARKCTARYNHVLLFLTREELDQYAAYNNWIKLGEKNRKSKGGLAIYYRCSMEKQNRGRCQHKMMAIKRPEGCFVAKTTDGGEPHKHKVRHSSTHQQTNGSSSEIMQARSQQRNELANEFDAICSLEELSFSHAVVTSTPIKKGTYQEMKLENIDSGFLDGDSIEFHDENTPVFKRNVSALFSKQMSAPHSRERHPFSTSHLPPAEKTLGKLTSQLRDYHLRTSTSLMPSFHKEEPSRRSISIQKSSHDQRLPSSAADRRSLQFSCTPPKCTYRRRSWPDDLFEGVPRDLLKKVKWMRDRQKGDKMIDLEKIASDLFAQMDCRHQSELLSLCC